MAADKKLYVDCVFCRELSGSRDTNFATRYPEISSRIVGESESLVAFPCIGQLNPGHFLVVPKDHDTTLRETAIRTPDIQLQFQTLIRDVHTLLDEDEDESLYFEHGAGCAANGGCGIYHAHLHVIPKAGNINLKQHFSESLKSQYRFIHDALSAFPQEGPYVMFGSSSQGFFSQRLNEALPSQTLRRFVGNELNTGVWDWREAGREVEMLNVLKKAVSL